MGARLPRRAPRLSTPTELEALTGLRCLGAIPPARGGAMVDRPSLAVVEADDLPLRTSFRNAHAMLLRACPQAQVIALSSAMPGDGKTTCSLALARQNALSGRRTVLVDCDLRRRSTSTELDTIPAAGLLEVISADATLDQALSHDGFTSLSILPVTNDRDRIRRAVVGDALGALPMAALIALLRTRFDHVFLDAPPVLGIADTRRLAPLADAILFIARSRRTSGETVRTAVDMLESTGTPIAGAVLTRAAPERAARAPQGGPSGALSPAEAIRRGSFVA